MIVVAHDPGMSVLAERLSDGEIEHMPTCAVATFTWDQDDWEVVDAVEPAGLDLRQPALSGRPETRHSVAAPRSLTANWRES